MPKIQILFMDVDGTMTDGKIYMGEHGEIMKAFDIKDGYAICNMLPPHNIVPVIITGRTSGIVEKRCKELGITEVHQGCINKKEKMYEVARNLGIKIDNNGRMASSAYIGDDVLDLPAMELCELVGCPNDAVDEVKHMASYVCKKKAGQGAIREFVEWILSNEEE